MQESLLPNSDPDFRLRSAVRQLCKWRAVWGLQKFREYLSKYQIDSQLLNLFADQWQKGNKGEWGKWI
jgi:hypothetical protein